MKWIDEIEIDKRKTFRDKNTSQAQKRMYPNLIPEKQKGE